MCKVIGFIAACMLAIVVYLHVTLHKGIADMALGYAAGLVVAGCAVGIHRCYKGKGEVR